jgi:hypothetical protein
MASETEQPLAADSPAASGERRIRTWRPRFSLRVLMLGVLFLSLLLGWAGDHLRLSNEIRRISNDENRIHGQSFLYDDGIQLTPQIRDFARDHTIVYEPAYVSMYDPVDYDLARASQISRVRILRILGGNVSSKGWASLADMESLDHLVLNMTTFSDRDMAALDDLDLRTFSIGDSGLGDESLRHLSHMNGLRHLSVRGSKNFTGAGYRYLVNLPSLEKIEHSETAFDSDSLRYLAGMNRLRELDLWSCPNVGGGKAGVHLGKLTSLEVLILVRTSVNDEDIEHLRGLSNLRELALAYTSVTDASVPILGELKGLRYLSIGDDFPLAQQTSISAAGLERLRQMLPNCQIR